MKHYCVISHTHWDREWYHTREQFRLRLIDLFDHLLEILEREPEYIFHMDAQTVVLEDYWEVCPEKKELCCRYIAEGRLLVGPWYVQNDFFLTSGEATVRNLLLGTAQAREYGRCETVGYTPDQFGLISQLPQIFQGFGIDNCVFGRGYLDVTVEEDGTVVKTRKPSEFLWKSPDGSKVLAVCMSYWYNNAQRFSAVPKRALWMAESAKELFEGIAGTPYLLLMNGVDHLEAQEDLLPILQEVQRQLPADERIYQTTLERYVKQVREALPENCLSVHVGELMQGGNTELLKDTASSRIYLKTANCELQNLLEHRLEPLYAMLEACGMTGIYPKRQLHFLWKMLIRNHAHDSICGCSKDMVHRHMEARFASISEMAEELLHRGMVQLAAHVRRGLTAEDYLIVAFNGLQRTRTEVVETTVDIAASDESSEFAIFSPAGREIPFAVLSHECIYKGVFSPINLPGFVKTERYRIRMLAEHVPGFGYTAYRVAVKKGGKACDTKKPLLYQENRCYCLENSYIKAIVMPDGRIDVLHKRSDHRYEDVLTVQDVADMGDSYIFMAAPADVPIELKDYRPEFFVEAEDGFLGQLRLHYEMELPCCYEKAEKKRSEQKVRLPLDIQISLGAKAKQLAVTFRFTNTARDHRLRALVRTGLASDRTAALAPYDIVSRSKWENDVRYVNESQHNSGMVAIEHNGTGMAVLNRGIYCYENLQKEQGTLGFTLVRATGRINREGAGVPEDDSWEAPENQCLRELTCELALMPWSGEGLAVEAAHGAQEFQNPLTVQCEPVDTHKFSGGRTAVQDSRVAELFYRETPYSACRLEGTEQFCALAGENLQVTALKKAQEGNGYILRFYNMEETVTNAVLELGNGRSASVWKTNLAETAREALTVEEHRVRMSVKEKEIVTLMIEYC